MNDQFTKDDIEFDYQFLTLAAYKKVTGREEVYGVPAACTFTDIGGIYGVDDVLRQWEADHISKEELRSRVRNLPTHRRGVGSATYLIRHDNEDDKFVRR